MSFVVFQYLMKLHYSQTTLDNALASRLVSVPYEITLLSNLYVKFTNLCIVSVPYEITLLSNDYSPFCCVSFVSVPYEITLLSNDHC